ncbi:MAG: UPF0179 family protein [Euryarchaeota archaeon]|nr:UPF0179 family protein [Euryarchaeota archaeon]
MITLIGKSLAKEGLQFMYTGSARGCESCRFKNTCIDPLEEGRIYVINDVKGGEHSCPIHEGGKVKVVDVEKADIEALVDSKKAFEGSMIAFDIPDCDEDCPIRDLCFPRGLFKDDKCKIVKSIGKPDRKCIKGFDLSLVLLRR